MSNIRVIELRDNDEFEKTINELLGAGYRILSSSCNSGFTAGYAFTSEGIIKTPNHGVTIYTAILLRES